MIDHRPHEPELVRVDGGASRAPRRGLLGPKVGGAEPSVRDVVATLYEERWLALGVAAVVSIAVAAYLALAPRIYEARIVVQVEDTSRTLAGLQQLGEILGEKRPADPEIAIMRSRVLLGSVVDGLGLDVDARPEPTLVERLLARAGLAPPQRASEADKDKDPIRLAQLSVSDDLLGKPLLLTAGEGGRYRLTTVEGEELLTGDVGRRARAEAGERRVEVTVAELSSPPGARFVVRRVDREDVIDQLRAQLRIAEAGHNTGIIEVLLDGRDPRRIASILNAFASAYVRQNVERKSSEAEKTLEFLEHQLPLLKADLDRAESQLERFQTRKGTASLSRKTETMLNRSVDVERELSELELQRTELLQRFTPQHPQVVSVTGKIDQLRGKRAAMEGGLKQLPAAELESARLVRDQKVASQLYDLLLNKAQELRVVRSGIVGNVRVLDHARVPRHPSSPRQKLVLMLGFVLAAGGGIGAALLRRALDVGVDDPDEIEARVGLPVYVTIPHTDVPEKLERGGAGRRPRVRALALEAPHDVAVESLRSLRTALQFALVEARSNVITIGSPSPGVGKSFVSANLALLLAAAGRRVLLVDADLRRGRLHRYFGLGRDPGLSDALTGEVALDDAVRETGVENLHVLTTGRIPPNPAELLASQRFQAAVATLAPRFDYVLVDTPPVLAVTDPTLVARCAGVNLLVVRAGQHPMREIAAAVKQFTQNGFPMQGAILNDARSTRHGYGRYGRYYEYRPDLH